jgi:DNA-binding HxlR family transcriptional regulator
MIGNNTGHAQANLGKKRDGIMSDRVRKSMSIWNGYADRQKEEIRVLYRQCPGEEDQSVQFAIALIHGKWKIGIISNLRRGPVRLSQLRRMFPQASKKMLAQQLREMERDGLIIRTDLSGRLRHVEYSLSDSGWGCCIAAHQHSDRMGLAIWIIAAQARSYLQLVRVHSFWIAGLRVFPSADRKQIYWTRTDGTF